MSDLMREEFEAWTANHDYLGGVELDRTISGNYADIDMQHAWQSWQASRECLVIELPEPRAARGYGEQVADALGFNDAINYCEEVIHEAGVKTK